MINEPDGFLGAVYASQSVKGLKVLINGPGGCRSRAVNLLRESLLEYGGEESCCCRSKFMSNTSILPCTYLNADDIILGSGNKIAEGLRNIISGTGSDVVLVDTLGATVQVVDREEAVRNSGYPDKVILAEEDLSDCSFSEGFDDTMMRIAGHFARKGVEHRKGSVNVLGYTQADRSWDYGKEEIRSMLASIGLEVVCFVGCDCTQSEIESSSEAEFNILIRPEYSIETARFYEHEFGVPFIVPSEGTPVGFDSIRSFLREVSEFAGTDATKALSDIDQKENHLFKVIQNYDKHANAIRGSSFLISGLDSDVLPISKLLADYFNVVPRSVTLRECNGGYDDRRVMEYLKEIGSSGAMDVHSEAEDVCIYLTDGYAADLFSTKYPSAACIGILFPYPDVVPLSNRCLIGISGTYNLFDGIMNGLRRFVCGQPTRADFR